MGVGWWQWWCYEEEYDGVETRHTISKTFRLNIFKVVCERARGGECDTSQKDSGCNSL